MSKARRWCHAENFFRRSRVFAVADVVAGGGLWLAIGPPHLVVAVVARPRLAGGIVADPGLAGGLQLGAGGWVKGWGVGPAGPALKTLFFGADIRCQKFFCADGSDRMTGESCNAGSRKQTGGHRELSLFH